MHFAVVVAVSRIARALRADIRAPTLRASCRTFVRHAGVVLQVLKLCDTSMVALLDVAVETSNQ